MGRRDTLLLSILTLITAFGWIAFDVYHASIDTTIPQEVERQLVPITPRFERSVIERINRRQNIEPLTSSQIVLSPSEASPATQPVGQ